MPWTVPCAESQDWQRWRCHALTRPHGCLVVLQNVDLAQEVQHHRTLPLDDIHRAVAHVQNQGAHG